MINQGANNEFTKICYSPPGHSNDLKWIKKYSVVIFVSKMYVLRWPKTPLALFAPFLFPASFKINISTTA
jgi:hypothetical protein